MRVTKEILPIRTMLGKDWKKIDAGFVIAGSRDSHIPQENSFSKQIIRYLLNTQLVISNYTEYDKFSWYLMARVESAFDFRANEVSVISEYEETYLRLNIYWFEAQELARANKHEALQIYAQLLLDSVPKYLFHRTDFDGEKFYEDILPIVKPIADGTRTFQEEEFPL